MAGTIDMPDSPPVAYAMFAHCFTGSRFTPAAARISKTLTEFGIATLRFDFPGLGQSEGEFADTSFTSNVADIVAAHEWMREHYAAPQLLIGHSLGGAASLKAATQLRDLRAVATLGAPFDPAHAVLHFADRIKDVDEHGAVTVVLGGRDVVISRAFLEDLADTNPEIYLPLLRKPLLLVHSPIDETVGVDNAQNIFLLTRYPKSLVSLDRADHLATRQGVAQRAGRLIGTWVESYLVAETELEAMESGAVAHSAKGSRFADTVRTPVGTLTTDRPKAEGGKNLGHSSADLIAAALAADASQAIRDEARKARLQVDDVSVTVVPEGRGFARRIRIDGALDDVQRHQLLRAVRPLSVTVRDVG